MFPQCHVRINVAKADRHMSVTGSGKLVTKYTHFFATEIKCNDPKQAKEVFQELVGRFPAPQWNVTATFWQVEGREVTQMLWEGK